MPTPSTLTTILFCVVVLGVALIVGYGLRRAGVRNTVLAVGFLVYLAIPGLLARMGVLDRYNPLPAPALMVVLAVSIVTAVLVFSSTGSRLAATLSVGSVVALQSFRIPVELLLHRLYVEGVIPIQMSYAGRNFDVISGLTGLALGVWLLSGRAVSRPLVLAWNLLGLGLLANIVIIAVLSTPVPFRQFTEGPPNLLPGVFPYDWLPTFLVQVALGSHLLVFRQLSRRP